MGKHGGRPQQKVSSVPKGKRSIRGGEIAPQHPGLKKFCSYGTGIDTNFDVRCCNRYTPHEGSPVETVKVSPKCQVVIPKKVREELQLKPGVELHVYVLDGTIRLSPPRSITELRGIAKGMRWKNEDRDHSERL